MPVLKNPRHERFARVYVEHSLKLESVKASALAAYEAIGCKPYRRSAEQMAQRQEIAHRIEELTAEALEYSDIRISKAVNILNHIAEASIADFYDAKTGQLKPIATLPRHLADAVKKVEFSDGALARIELHDKIRALQIIMQHLGGTAPEEKPSITHNTLNVTISDEQRVAALMSLLAKAKPNGSNGESTS